MILTLTAAGFATNCTGDDGKSYSSTDPSQYEVQNGYSIGQSNSTLLCESAQVTRKRQCMVNMAVPGLPPQMGPWTGYTGGWRDSHFTPACSIRIGTNVGGCMYLVFTMVLFVYYRISE